MDDVVLADADPGSPPARQAMARYFEELAGRLPGGFDPGHGLSEAAIRYTPPAGAFLLALDRDEPVACGALEHLDDDVSEIKRMWVSPRLRGHGVGRRLLAGLEGRARDAGRSTAVLDTNAALTEAVGLYVACGYEPVPAYNDNPHADRWFSKRLRPVSSAPPRRP